MLVVGGLPYIVYDVQVAMEMIPRSFLAFRQGINCNGHDDHVLTC